MSINIMVGNEKDEEKKTMRLRVMQRREREGDTRNKVRYGLNLMFIPTN